MPRWQDHEEYFWGLVKKGKGNYCWKWKGGTSKGYGRICKDGKRTAAHRVAYEYAKGPIPKGKLACHHCDNKLCVRPSHIFIGTHKDNMQDWTKKGKNILINNPEMLKRGDDHWTRKKTKKTKIKLEKISSQRREEWSSGRRVMIRDKKTGRILGTRVVQL